MKNYCVNTLGNGWYDFTDIPQEKSYVKVHALCSGTDRKAKNFAKKILRNQGLEVEAKNIWIIPKSK